MAKTKGTKKNKNINLFIPFDTGTLLRVCEPVKLNAFHSFLLHLEYKPKIKNTNCNNSKKVVSENDAYIAYRFEMFPTEEQSSLLRQTTGACRWLWNKMKADHDDMVRQTGFATRKTPADYKKVPEYAWLKDVDSLALANVQLRHEKAYSDWKAGIHGKPKFKKKHLHRESYTTNCVNGNIKLTGNALTLPKVGAVAIRKHRELIDGTIKNVTVTLEPNGRWYASVVVQYEADDFAFAERIADAVASGTFDGLRHIGLDMSLPNMYVDSEGHMPSYTLVDDKGNDTVVSFVKCYRNIEDRIAKEQHKLSKMIKDSKNYKKQCVKIARLHSKAKNRRNDFICQIAVRLARTYDVISIEDLDMSAMKRALKFGKSVSDNGWGAFVEVLGRKCEEYGHVLVRVDKWFPSSKTCSCCGYVKKDLQKNERTYICPMCGNTMDRDEQAAINIDREGMCIFEKAFIDTDTKKKQKAIKIRVV